MTGFFVQPLDGFEGDPLATEEEYLIDEQFAESLAKLEPSWDSQSSTLLNMLRALDDAGLLRPRFHLVLPQAYAQYDYDRDFASGEARPADSREFGDLRESLYPSRRHFDDPAAVHPLESDPVLAPYLAVPSTAGPVDWDQWTHVVGQFEAVPGVQRPIHRTSTRAYYASWQRLHAWALLERQTVRFLLDPRRLTPEDLYRTWNYDLTGSWLMSRMGDGRYARLFEMLGSDRWLTGLYRSRALASWAQLRAFEPAYQLVDEATQALSIDARWSIERDRLVQRCAALAAPWNRAGDTTEGWTSSGAAEPDGAVPVAFRQRVRALLELWSKATTDGHTALVSALAEDIDAAASCATLAFDTTFSMNDAQIAAPDVASKASLGAVLRPERTRSRRVADVHLGYLIEAFNRTIAVPQLEGDDFARFLGFLDDSELWAWTIELAAVLAVRDGAPDTVRDRSFLNLRSLALLNEEVLTALAWRFGTDQDRDRVAQSGPEATLKVFLCGRGGWRERVWMATAQSRRLTRTNGVVPLAGYPWLASDEPGERLAKCIGAIAALELNATFAGAVKQILTYWAFRNFGAHRFSRRAQLLREFGPHLRGATIFCPLFYWKIATSLG